MKKTQKSNIAPVTDTEYNELLHEIAVINGLQVPETPEEVAAFEQQFADDISSANRGRPGLEEMLSLAKEINSTGEATIKPKLQPAVDSRYKMAARNGNSITQETEDLMDKAIQKAKEKRLND